MITTTTFAPQTRAAQQAPPAAPPAEPAEPTPAPPTDGSDVGAPPQGESFLSKAAYQGTRLFAGAVGGFAGGVVGATAGGIKHAADDIAPENKITKGAAKILKWAGATAGAGFGVALALGAGPLGIAAGLIGGLLVGAGVGGGLPGAAEGVAAAACGTAKGLVHGAKAGWEKTTGVVDKLFGKNGEAAPPEPPKAGPPANPNGPIAQVD